MSLLRLTILVTFLLAGCHSMNFPFSRQQAALPRIVVPRCLTPPQIDGKLDDEAWQQAAVIHGLQPARGEDTWASIRNVPTEIRLLWDEDFLYVAFICQDEDIFTVPGPAGSERSLHRGDVCEVFFDGMGDQRQWCELQVNSLNQSFDACKVMTAPPRFLPDGRLAPDSMRRDCWGFKEIDLKSRHAVQKTAAGWNVEIAIPARFIVRRRGWDKLQPMQFRANFIRYDWQRQKGETERTLLHMNWSPVVKGCPHISPLAMGYVILAGF